MKEKQNKRWGLKLLSVLCAFLVWLGVVNVADPVMTSTVEVPVEIVNGEVLEASGLTYEIIGKKTTTVSYEVKTTNAHRIRPADFRAYADMTDLWSVTGSIPVKVEVLNHSEYLLSAPARRSPYRKSGSISTFPTRETWRKDTKREMWCCLRIIYMWRGRNPPSARSAAWGSRSPWMA